MNTSLKNPKVKKKQKKKNLTRTTFFKLLISFNFTMNVMFPSSKNHIIFNF